MGKRFRGQDERGTNDDWLTVIGVVRNTRRQGLEQDPTPHVYEWHKQAGPVTGLVVRTTGEPAALASVVHVAIREVEPRAVVSESMPMRQHIDRQTASRRFQTWLLSLFASLAMGVGFSAAFLGTQILSGLLYGVSATDPATFAGAGVVLLAVGASAVILPAWRATHVDPVVSLRAD